MKYTPEQIIDLLLVLEKLDTDYVIVGGQAINLWANLYSSQSNEWQIYQPFSSEDLDIFGSRLDAFNLSQALNCELYLAKDFDSTPNVGVIIEKSKRFRIDILATVYGLSDGEISSTAVNWEGTIQSHRFNLRILNPILCLESKLKCLRGLPQAGRQDLKHSKISVLIVHSFLSESIENYHSRMVLNMTERILSLATKEDGLSSWYKHQITVESAIPFDILQATVEPKYQKFLEIRWPQIQNSIEEKRLRYRKMMTTFLGEKDG